MPTVGREPGRWNVPAWVAGPPAVLFVLAAGIAGCVLSWWWAADSYSAAMMTDRLLASERAFHARPLPETVAPPDGTWTRSTAQHLAHWAIYHSLLDGEDSRPIDEIRSLVERALACSPLNPTARLAAAQLESPGRNTTVSIRSLGLSRDMLSLAWTARKLLAAGQNDAALRMFGQALRVAIPSESSRSDPPVFSDDPSVPRYRLPGEEPIRQIVRELASTREWSLEDWLAILPESAVVRLAAARALREHDPGQADSLLNQILHAPEDASAPGADDALALAARAEAFALRSRWSEAQDKYRRAIERIDDDTIKRSWWYNVADIASRLDDDPARQAALRAALAVAASDEISRRAAETQRATRAQLAPRSTGVKAN
jgi:tetratricopeptide (TPR) repeat protein